MLQLKTSVVKDLNHNHLVSVLRFQGLILFVFVLGVPGVMLGQIYVRTNPSPECGKECVCWPFHMMAASPPTFNTSYS